MTESERQYFDDKFQGIEGRLEEHHTTLFGNLNGNPNRGGLVMAVHDLTEESKRREKSKSYRMWLWGLAALAGLGGLINLIVLFVKGV